MKFILKNILAIQLFVVFLYMTNYLDVFVVENKYIAIMIASVLNSFVFACYWWYLVCCANNEVKIFEMSFSRSQPLLTFCVPRIKQDLASKKNHEDLIFIVEDNYFSAIYFILALLGAWGLLGLQYDFDVMMRGVFGAPLKSNIGRAVFLMCASYFLIYGLSIFFLGLFSKIFKGVKK